MKNRAVYALLSIIQIFSIILSICLYPIFLITWIFTPKIGEYWFNFMDWLDDKIVDVDILINKNG